MKKMKKFFALMVAMVVVLSMAIPAMAATVDSGNGGDGSITITLPTEKTAPTKDTVYKLYKVFDATVGGSGNIAYTSRQGETMPTGFVLDTAGNVHHGTKALDGTITDSTDTDLTDAEIAAIAAYVRDADLVYTATVAKGEKSVKITGLEYGYYYITTSSGTAVTINSNNPNVDVNDKNIIPIVKKSPGTEYDAESRKAIAAVGTSQPFTAQINVGHGTKNLVFTDTMTNMTYDGNVKVTVSGDEVNPGTTTFSVSGEQGDASFTVTFVDSYIAGLDDETIITLNYSGTITSDALSINPATNTASITSGDENNDDSDTVEVYNAKFTVSKKDGDGEPLAGAGFVIQNEDGKYYKLADNTITWVDTADAADTHSSDDNGAVPPFMGLKDGTYTLIEYIVPSGYNKAADSTFTIAASDYSVANLEQSADVTNQAGSTLPSTGGIGTTIFYVVGAILVVGAGVVLITRRRMSA